MEEKISAFSKPTDKERSLSWNRRRQPSKNKRQKVKSARETAKQKSPERKSSKSKPKSKQDGGASSQKPAKLRKRKVKSEKKRDSVKPDIQHMPPFQLKPSGSENSDRSERSLQKIKSSIETDHEKVVWSVNINETAPSNASDAFSPMPPKDEGSKGLHEEKKAGSKRERKPKSKKQKQKSKKDKSKKKSQKSSQRKPAKEPGGSKKSSSSSKNRPRRRKDSKSSKKEKKDELFEIQNAPNKMKPSIPENDNNVQLKESRPEKKKSETEEGLPKEYRASAEKVSRLAAKDVADTNAMDYVKPKLEKNEKKKNRSKRAKSLKKAGDE